MADSLGQAYVQIIPSAKGISGMISNELSGETDDAGKKSGNKYISAFKKVLTGAAVGKWVGNSILAGADLEQSLGGIETLYKDSADKMKEYASEAYRTAGVDANTYMEQVTSYSAGLIASMGGDVDAAADVANMAMLDMADNANKLGTPLESIQNAYQGFAKQNYTMLDNLKLGYGGTKEEMERLLADAEKISGVEYDISNLDDVYNAIHVVQEEMGITGTTAKEASETISGSLGMWKASYKDLVANLALGNDIYPQIENLVSSSIAVLKNVLPAIGNIVLGIPKVIVQHWPDIVAAVKTGIGNLIAFVQEHWPKIRDAALGILTNIGRTIIENIPMMLAKVKEMLQRVIDGIGSSGPGIFDAVKSIIGTLIQNLPAILSSLFSLAVSLVKSGLKLAWSAVQAAFQTILNGVGSFASNILSKIRSGLASVKNAIAKPFQDAWGIVQGAWQKIKGIFPIKLGKIFDGIKLPHFKISGGSIPWGVGGVGEKPSVRIEWYKKAESEPYMFSGATLFGAGERNDEILYGRRQLMRDIAQATSGGDITINVYGAQGQNINDLAAAVESRLIEAQKRRRLAWQ